MVRECEHLILVAKHLLIDQTGIRPRQLSSLRTTKIPMTLPLHRKTLAFFIAVFVITAVFVIGPCWFAPRYVGGQETLPSDRVGIDNVTTITTDTVLDPAKSYGRIVIAGSGITIDGRGTILVGSDTLANQRTGVAISSAGHDNVVLKNISARGWETGLKLEDASGWKVENCDFSDNFHDPDFGWGENGRRGGIVLENVHRSSITNCKANRVWDACVLVGSDENRISNNDFSHTSNTCLKLWNSIKNEIAGNNLSYGIRIKQNEVHARDSTGVLIESGSNENQFTGNDCTYGGDGIFIRVLNGWCSTDNVFINNDCSYANNNGFECWAPRNYFYSNKANHCSYGFWLGGSDQTRLLNNEASFNGLPSGNHNSPHLPDQGHAGIVFMFGPSSHILAYGNRCEGNNGAGIALVGDQASKGAKWKAYHWVLAGNVLENNRWGIFAQYADWITLAGNSFSENTSADVLAEEGISRLSTRSGELVGWIGTDEESIVPSSAPQASKIEVLGPESVNVHQSAMFRLLPENNGFSRFQWDLGPVAVDGRNEQSHVFEQPGFYRIGVTASGAAGIDLAFLDVYVTSSAPEIGSDVSQWSFEREARLECTYTSDVVHHVKGDASIKVVVAPYHGSTVRLLYPQSFDAGLSLAGKSKLGFWFKAINPNLPGWQSNNPEITLYQSKEQSLRLTPTRDLLQDQTYNEARTGWRYIEIPLDENPDWQREGSALTELNAFTIGVDSWGGDPLQLWVDGVTLE